MKKRTARLAVAAAAIAVIAPLSGCAALLSAQQTAQYEYHGGDGSWSREDLDGIEVRGLLLLQNDEGDAQAFYTLVNEADEPRDVTITVGSETFEQSVDAGSAYIQYPENPDSAPEPAMVPGLNADVGSLEEVEVEVGSTSETILVQVLDGALPEYADLVPDSGSATSDQPTDGPTTDAGEDATQG